MGATKTLLTAEQFDNYPFEEDKRYELDEGEMIEMTRPAYNHNRIVLKLTVALHSYLEQRRTGEFLNSENLFAVGPFTRLAPDAAVILGDRHAELQGAKVIQIIPDIAVEVLSPNETQRRVHRKLGQYFTAGVKEVWLIDPEDRSVEIWTGPSLPEHSSTGDAVISSVLLPEFALSLPDLFS